MKLTDARIDDEVLQQTVDGIPTPEYMPPEYCESKTYNKSGDIWGLGILLYELCAGEKPIDETLMKKIIKNLESRDKGTK